MQGSMNSTKKIIIGILVIGLLAGLTTLLFGMAGPFYRTDVVNLPINLETPSNHKTSFTVDRSEDYLIEVHLDTIFPEDKIDFILGDYRKSGGGAINITWSIDANNSFLTRGSSKAYGYSPIFSSGHSGLTIGAFKAEKDKNYTLSITTHNNGDNWNKSEPYIEVGLHPSKLENYLVLQMLGFLLTSLFGVALLLLFVKSIFFNTGNASKNV